MRKLLKKNTSPILFNVLLTHIEGCGGRVIFSRKIILKGKRSDGS